MKKLVILPFIIFFAFRVLSQVPVGSFGTNPGNLSMYLYEPAAVAPNAALVLVLHGCSQNAGSFAMESGWNQLADQHGFYVIYAEQKSSNNSSRCFNWFENGDISRGAGEAASLKSMVDYVKANYTIDGNSVYVTGFSAGGAMTSVMMAAYPDVFSAGVVMSGLPYKVASGSNEAFMAMFGNINKSPQQLGNLVRNAFSSFNGNYPRLAVIHGASDYTVYFMNQRELMEQWTNVHGTDQVADLEDAGYENNALVTRKAYKDQHGNDVVVTYSIDGMGHAIAVDPGSGEKQGGQTGTYASDVDLFSSYIAAQFFEIIDVGEVFEAPDNVQAVATSPSEIRLTWNDNATTETSYAVERSLNPDNQFINVVSLSANTTSYNDTGLDAETRYYYRITAVNASNETAVSQTVSATTLAEGEQGELVVIEQPNGSGILSYNNGQHMGQSFMATVNGRLETVSFNLVNAVSGSALRIYNGNSVTGQPVYEQPGINMADGWQTITLQNGPELLSGQLYTVQLTEASIKYSYSNLYGGGNFWYNGIAYTVFDAAFKVGIRENHSSLYRIGDTGPQHQVVFLYPNPATDRIYIRSSSPDVWGIKMISVDGRIGRTKAEWLNGTLLLDVSSLSKGLYLLHMVINDEPYTCKIMIRR
ncbi:PHB depolymerase family esterase [Fulvivirga ulvae]|uniref:extracellular catalytic domain type 1 short-chain-length polyhydroxyalkanoate depolymerase n=1 Tax=Fulvivirga ulvae TaxID=2904245 RepID=UPI001F406F43|nr:PHB depolymerase family esterase [Fulvivirga ulvae]UII30893.1 PHB depolymerase family esterase [Fulvivirga ulvae]